MGGAQLSLRRLAIITTILVGLARGGTARATTIRAVDVFRSERIAIQGDSITTPYAWYGPLQTTINAAYLAPITPKVVLAGTPAVAAPVHAGAVTSAAPGTAGDFRPTWGIYGHSGQGIDYLLANEAEVISFNPTLILLEIGTNNFGTPSMAAKMTQLCNDYLAALPSVRIGVMSVVSSIAGGEQNPDPVNASVNGLNANLAAGADATGAAYLDMRTVEQAYEAVNNTPSPGSFIGPLTVDGVHPKDPAGTTWWSSTALGYMVLHNTVGP